MKGCLQFLAFLTAVLFMGLTIATIATVTAVRTVTDRDNLKRAVDIEEVARAVIPEMMVQTIQDEIKKQGLPEINLDTATVSAATDKLLPPGWADAQADALIDATFDVLQTPNQKDITAQIDIRPILDEFRGPNGRQVIRLALQNLPPCTDEDLTNAALGLVNGEFHLPTCLPGNMSLDEATQFVHQTIVETLDVNPDLVNQNGLIAVPLFESAKQSPDTLQMFENLRWLIQTGRDWLYALWIIPLGLLILIALLAVRSISGLGHWWGWPLVAAGGGGLLFGFGMSGMTSIYGNNLFTNPQATTQLDFATAQVFNHTIALLGNFWFRQVVVQSAVVLGVGMLFVVLGVVTGFAFRDESGFETFHETL